MDTIWTSTPYTVRFSMSVPRHASVGEMTPPPARGNFYPMELKLGKIILHVSSHNRWKPNFSIFQGGAVEECPMKFSNQFTTLSIGPIEVELGRIILDTPTNNAHIEGGCPCLRTKWGQRRGLSRMWISKKLVLMSLLPLIRCILVQFYDSNSSQCWTFASFANARIVFTFWFWCIDSFFLFTSAQ